MYWLRENDTTQDTHGAFRATFHLEAETTVELRTLGASWYVFWLDGIFFGEGPARYDRAFPEYEPREVKLPAGRHVLACQVHSYGLDTRILENIPPFIQATIHTAGYEIPLHWKCLQLQGYHSGVRRINPQLGWIEWCDTRQIPQGWNQPEFEDSGWQEPVRIDLGIGNPIRLTTALTHSTSLPMRVLAQGPLAEYFGYERDDISARFFLRDLECTSIPAQGVWRRYDLGRVRLGRPRLKLNLPPGALVEVSHSESLLHGRVAPYINLSAGASCNLDHFIARGGEQEFFPLTPKGGRFIEVHILSDPSRIQFLSEEFIDRGYHEEPAGSFECNEQLLNRIWLVGIDTFRACAEDAVIDNPTRERGQWTGDVVGVGMDIAASGYTDLRLLRRGLVQSAQSARADGLVAGMSPGGSIYLSTYALQWVTACVHYVELTGDRSLLEQLYPAALKNFQAFDKAESDVGLSDNLGWAFVDWGYARHEGPIDVAVNLHFLWGLQSMGRWCSLIGKNDERIRFEQKEHRIRTLLAEWLADASLTSPMAWKKVGFHCSVLALSLGLIEKEKAPPCVDAIKAHILDCFPNNPEAPRLSDPSVADRRIITPYFSHYAFPLLIERGEMDFVLDQYRTCWGWMLEEDRTTWVEVFDPRWSHCHQWSGCPTWQLSRYCLGLHPRFDLGSGHYQLGLRPGSLSSGQGKVPFIPTGGVIGVSWKWEHNSIRYRIHPPVPITLHLSKEDAQGRPEVLPIEKEMEFSLPGRH